MYILYVDESGDTGPRGSQHLLLGATAIFEGRWSYIDADLQALIARYFPSPPRPSELHCTEIRGGRGAFAGLTRAQRTALLTDFCALATAQNPSDLRMFTVVVNKADWFAANPARPHKEIYFDAFEQLVSRFDLFLKRRHAQGQPSKGIVVIDYASTAMVAALRALLARYQAGGNQWSKLYNVVETVMFLSSHESPGLQLADLASFAVWRLSEFSDASLASQIATCFDREPATSAVNAGKWHGVKLLGTNGASRAAISAVWP